MSVSRWAAVRFDDTRHDATVKPADAPEVEEERFGSVGSGVRAAALAVGQRWVGTEDAVDGPRLVLEETSSYVFRVPASAAGPARAGLPGVERTPITSPRSSEVAFRVETNNLVGLSEIRFLDATGEVIGRSLPVRVRLRKLTDPDDDFEWLVDAIVARVRSLALTVASPTTLPLVRSRSGPSYAYEDLVFLRAVAKDVERAVERILRNPHRRIIDVRETQEAWAAADVDLGALMVAVAEPRSLASVPEASQHRVVSPAGRARLTRGERTYAFARVPGIRREVTHDTFENRFVRFVLESLRQRARAIARAAVHAKRPDLAAEADTLAVRFAAPLRQAPLSSVGRLTSLPNVTQVLLREDAYNALLRTYREYLLTSEVKWDDLRLLQENRDAATLYEMWVFLETVAAVAAIADVAGGPPRSERLIQLHPDGLAVDLAHGHRSGVEFSVGGQSVRVSYNATYVATSPDPRFDGRRGTYSVPLRPDVSLEVGTDGEARRILFDAKYRVERFGRGLASDPDDDGNEQDDPSSFKRPDIHKMHAYRDAISGAFASLAIYPGAEARFFPDDPEAFGQLGGVGALPLRPRQEADRLRLRRTVRRLIAVA